MPSTIIQILLDLLNNYCCPCALEREACKFFSQKLCLDFCAWIYLHSGYNQSEQWWKHSINQDMHVTGHNFTNYIYCLLDITLSEVYQKLL